MSKDTTIPGGVYLDEKGNPVDAMGQPIDPKNIPPDVLKTLGLEKPKAPKRGRPAKK